MDKQEIRQKVKHSFLSFNNVERKKSDEIISKKLLELPLTYKNIAVYMALEDEVNLEYFIINRMTCSNIYIPKITTDGLVFVRMLNFSDLANGPYNIKESLSNEYIDIAELDLVIVPMRAYDKNNNRVGRGKGYYDRVLSDAKVKIGVAYALQEVEYIPAEVFDVKMDVIFTEECGKI